MTDLVHDFRALHHNRAPGDPLVLPGPWDAASARAFEEAGFPALATPSAGVAASLGYADGAVPAAEMFAAVARIARAVSVPVSADLEGGYGLPPAELVARALESGVVGMNLEDTAHGSAPGTLKDPEAHADWLAEVRAEAGDRLFLNARVDSLLPSLRGTADRSAPELVADALDRARRYAAAGADCVYPIGARPADLPPLRAGLPPTLPLNALARPDGTSVTTLAQAGATRLTFGPALLHTTLTTLRNLAPHLRG
ncbi:isocitrate lyase/phosphoenolpyruvate mutase family protein [Streptomyces sp. LP05-1]|uniref:Isocitrate lyase/phosphoenolpyruvate mutase family protein n=1 Tax=Streptomyces pyxinae TaxID=2970734 RepID=A0ABT2CIZ3_9ACTN|nr:isocitrate lyase/phosphoenolpyruvate mutase family protein [Streptomyces sp. LP05-1]MCS0637067.1 isocitrate lyase/phosphoenolpyruvate mutase family protein [Streptomyces sp. LP05-1]